MKDSWYIGRSYRPTRLNAAFKANVRILEGAPSDEIIRMYRRLVRGDAKRLSKLNSGRPALKRRRRKWSSKLTLTPPLKTMKRPCRLVLSVERDELSRQNSTYGG